MRQTARPYRFLLVLLLIATARGQVAAKGRPQKPSQAKTAAAPDPDTIFLDPAYGEPGRSIGGVQEKDITLNLAIKLRDLLASHAFHVVMPPNNPGDAVAEDQQVELANRSHASACLLLHAATGGHGVHLYTSSLTAAGAAGPAHVEPGRTIIPWDTAQAAVLPQSLDLASDLATALNGIRIPLVTGRATVAPIDSLNCAGVAIELAPYTPEHGTALEPGDSAYQQRVAEAIATALLFRRQKIEAIQSGLGSGSGSGSAPVPARREPTP